jgi:hypothetical protein
MSLRGVLTTKQSPASFWACSDPEPFASCHSDPALRKQGVTKRKGKNLTAQGKLREESCHAQGRLREEEKAGEGSLDSSVASGNLRMTPIGL